MNSFIRRGPLREKTGNMSLTQSGNSRVAIVTGAAQGIGRAIALRLARDGLHVTVNDIPSKSKELQDVVHEIESLGQKGLSVPGDASEEDFVKNLVDITVEKLGSLDVFVANAAVILYGFILDTTINEWDNLMNINARGSFLAFREAAKQMIKQGRGGRIIGACSINGKKAVPGTLLYSGSKFFVRALVQTAAQEWAPNGITVNAYAPGPIETSMLQDARSIFEGLGDTSGIWEKKLLEQIPLGKVGTVEDVSGLVSYLASEESKYVTGQTININGGMILD